MPTSNSGSKKNLEICRETEFHDLSPMDSIKRECHSRSRIEKEAKFKQMEALPKRVPSINQKIGVPISGHLCIDDNASDAPFLELETRSR